MPPARSVAVNSLCQWRPLVGERPSPKNEQPQREEERPVSYQPENIACIRASRPDQGVCHLVELVNGRQQLYHLTAPSVLRSKCVAQNPGAQPDGREGEPV